MTATVSIDGKLVAPEAASISVFDRGLLYGDGLFEVLRTWGGVAVDLDAHLARLRASASELALAVPDELASWARAAIAAAPHGEGDHRVRIVVTRGPGALSARLGALRGGRAIVIVEPLPELPREMSLAIVDWPLPRRAHAHKTLAYLDHVIARELAAAAGADEAVRLDADGLVAEGATSNVFAVVAGTVVTSPIRGVLPGVTRARVLALCAEREIAIAKRGIAIAELRAADEIFITSALRGVVPVTCLDGVRRAAGPLARDLTVAYARVVLAPRIA